MLQRPILLFLFFLLGLQPAGAQKELDAYSNKLSPVLKAALSVYQPADSLHITLSMKNEKDLEPAFLSTLRVMAAYKPAGALVVRMKKEDFLKLMPQKSLLFADLVQTPREELTTGFLDLAVNKINYAHIKWDSIKGNGILVSVKEQQMDTTDIDYKNRYIHSGLAAPSVTAHASIMSTTIAGGGNTSPFAYGAAPAAQLTSSSFATLLPDADPVFQQYNISVQNHSYGTLLESYYGAEAAAYDKNSINNPALVHVFSSGNAGFSGATTGTYAGLQGFANLTGNFKQAKNVITVGAIDSFYNIAVASSRGPAFDGRVKPELVAFGEDGSSGAAALVSGTAALVQQAYKNRFDSLPSAALVKAVLLNSADDVGAPHIDYASGYGSLNGYEAVKTIQEGRFIESDMAAKEVTSFPLVVPPHTAQVKVTLVWTDVPAAANAPKALVNDVDMVVKNSRGESWLPWVLNHAANKEALLQGATRQKDTVNNVEHITIANPAAGNYEIQLTGRVITTDKQLIAIAYQIDTANYFEWTFPAANEIVIAGQANIIRWQSNRTGTAAIEYTTDNNNWKTITDAVNVQQRYFKWIAPDTLTTARLRMRFANNLAVTDTFVISRAADMQVGFNCTDSFLLFWNHLPAGQYQVFELGEKYLQPAMITGDTVVILKKDRHPSLYYSVAPVVKGRTGLKSYTINYEGQGAECYFRSFYTQLQTADSVIFSASIGSLYQVAAIAFQKQQRGGYTTLQTINRPAITAFSFVDSKLTQGLNLYRVQLTLSNGAVLYSNEVSIFHFPNAPVIVYPNPARQQEPVNIITSGAGRFTIEVWNATGVLAHQMQLTDLLNQLPPLRLSTGVYFIRIIGDDGKKSTQKLVVY